MEKRNPLPMQEANETGVPSVGRGVPWRRERQPTAGFLPGEPHGQRSLAGCSPGVTGSWTRLSRHTYAYLEEQICLHVLSRKGIDWNPGTDVFPWSVLTAS